MFVEDVKTVPIGKLEYMFFLRKNCCVNNVLIVGKVIKVDGCYVAVKFFSKDAKEKEKESKEKDFSTSDFKDMTTDDMIKLLNDCRLLRKDELQVRGSCKYNYSVISSSLMMIAQLPSRL